MTTMPPELSGLRASMEQCAFALAFGQSGTADKLSALTNGLGRLAVLNGDAPACVAQLEELRPRLLFLDFSVSQAVRSAALARQLASGSGQPALVAVGNSAVADSVLAALRAGVRDFIDLDDPDGEASAIVRRALSAGTDMSAGGAGATKGKMVVVLGARAGVGASSLAVNLAYLAQRRYGDAGRTLLLDFGLPVADASLYLNQKKEFDLLQAIHSLSRIDDTFIASAFATHASGFTLLPMPTQPDRMREISYEDTLSLLATMRGHFQTVIADLGGCTDHDFVATMVRQADEVILVCDPSAGAIVSARGLMQALGERGVIIRKTRLVLGKHDPALALGAADVAQRLHVEPLCELPHRHVPMLQATNQGKALVETAPHDPYVAALQPVLDMLQWLPAVTPVGTRFGGSLVDNLRGLIRR